MKNFEHRRDRFNAFQQYANPLVNLSIALELPDFRPYCKAQQLPPFHFFLFCLLTSIKTIDNFMYRIHDGEVIKIDEFAGSYTVLNIDNNLNYASFTMSDDLREFIARSVEAGNIAKASRELMNGGSGQSEREQKNNIYATCMPWFDLRAIDHPIHDYKNAEIPSIAWGKFSAPDGDRITVPFSVQAHHGFVDGYHVHLLAQAMAAKVAQLIG